jgi:hypothetical protein
MSRKFQGGTDLTKKIGDLLQKESRHYWVTYIKTDIYGDRHYIKTTTNKKSIIVKKSGEIITNGHMITETTKKAIKKLLAKES